MDFVICDFCYHCSICRLWNICNRDAKIPLRDVKDESCSSDTVKAKILLKKQPCVMHNVNLHIKVVVLIQTYSDRLLKLIICTYLHIEHTNYLNKLKHYSSY